MSGNSIGNASLVLSASGGELSKGLGDAAKGIKTWGNNIQTTVAGMAGAAATKIGNVFVHAKEVLGGAGAAIGMAIGGPIGGAIGQVVGSSIGGVVETITSALVHPFERVKELGANFKKADVLGLSASEYQGFTHVLERFGIEGDNATAIFAKMGRNITKIGQNKEGLGTLQQMGISVDELQKMNLTEQFKTLADGLNKLPRGAQQAAAAMNIFGKSGYELLPMLQKGGAGIDAFIEEGKATGAILSQSQLEAANKAAKAWKDAGIQMKEVWEGLSNRATMVAAPIIKFFAKIIDKWYKALLPVFDWLGRVLTATADILTEVFEVFGDWVEEAGNWLAGLVKDWLGFDNTLYTVEDVVFLVFKAMGQAVGYFWDGLRAGAGAVSFVLSFLVGGFGDVLNAFKEMVKGLLDVAGQLPDQLGGQMFRDASASLTNWGDGLKGAGDEMKKWGEGQMNTFGETANKIGAWFDKIKNKAKKDAAEVKKNADGTFAAPDYKGIAAAVKGSKEAYSIESKFNWDSKFAPKQKIDEKQLDAMKAVQRGVDKLVNIFGLATPLIAG